VLKFHWRLLQGGETAGISWAAAVLQRGTVEPELPAQLEFCRLAEDLGVTGLLLGATKPDPIVLLVYSASPAGAAQIGLDEIFRAQVFPRDQNSADFIFFGGEVFIPPKARGSTDHEHVIERIS
jgi:hypothetical protein